MTEKDEPEGARLDRKLIELLNELRVALPGVQVLLGFLLVVPFNAGWATTTGAERDVYAVALISAALASILLIAPSSYHRLRFKRLHAEGLDNKKQMLITNDRLAIGGFLFLSVAITASVWVPLAHLFGWVFASVTVFGLAATFGWFWYGLPLSRRFRDPRHGP
jgi:hypothetical protein